MKPLSSLAFAASLAAAVLSVGRAQAQVFEDPLGLPMQSIAIPALTPGTEYEFRTDYVMTPLIEGTTPWAALSLHESSVKNAPLVGTTSCCDHLYPDSCIEQGAACFTYVAQGPASTARKLFLRAVSTMTPGSTSLWYRELHGDTATAWVSLGENIEFGGGVMQTNVVSNERFYLQTLLRPGGPLHHNLVTSYYGGEWLSIRWGDANGRVGDTAMLDWGVTGSIPFSALTYSQYFGTLEERANGVVVSSQGSGPMGIALVHPLATDWDHDGLDATLEQSLGTCDSTGQFAYCAQAPGCGTPYNQALCQSSLRDTDHDGLTDPLELFGYDDPKLYLPRFGANPTHMDVFVEMDSLDQKDNVAGCQGFETVAPSTALSNSASVDYFDQVAKAFGRGPAFLNPDATPGIRVHYDVGIDNPNPSDTRWGNWGGGNKCLGSTSSCIDGGCTTSTISAVRKGLFIHGVDYQLGGGVELGSNYIAGEPTGHIHELGHAGNLAHEAPVGAGGFFGGMTSRRGYPTVMNYAYNGYFYNHGFDDYSFSFGTWAPVNYREVPEIAPFGLNANLQIMSYGDVVSAPVCQGNGTSACPGTGWNVDWNHSGEYSGVAFQAGAVTAKRTWGFSALNQQAPELLRLGSMLVLAVPEAGPKTVVRVDTDANCDPYSDTPCVTFADAATFTGANAIALAKVPVASGGGQVDGLLVVRRESAQLRWSLMTLTAGSGADQVSVSQTNGDLIRDSGGNAISTTTGPQFKPTLVSLPGTGALLLYANAAGKLMEATYTASTATWSAPQNALDSAGVQLGFDTSVAAHDWNGVAVLAGVIATTSIYGDTHTYKRVSGHWEDFGTPMLNTKFLQPALMTDSAQTLRLYSAKMYSSNPTWVGHVALGSSWGLEQTDLTYWVNAPYAIIYDDRPNIPTTAIDLRRVGVDSSLGAYYTFQPFTLLGEPAISGDYNEWYQFKQGYCYMLNGAGGTLPISPGDAAFVPTAYTTRDCGPSPVYPKPCPLSAGGSGYCCGGAVVAAGTICQ